MPNNTPTARAGERLRELRNAKGLSQGEVVDAARRHGLSWGQASLSQLEGGKRGLSGDELLALPLILTELLGRDVPLTELLCGGTDELPGGLTLDDRAVNIGRRHFDSTNIGLLLCGGLADYLEEIVGGEDATAINKAEYEAAVGVLHRLVPDRDAWYPISRSADTDLGRRAGRRFATDPLIVAAACWKVTGKSLNDARAELASSSGVGDQAKVAAAGTRKLYDNIEATVEAFDRKAKETS